MLYSRLLKCVPWLAGLLFLVVFVPGLIQRSFRQDLDIVLIASERLFQGLPVYIDGINPHTKPPFLGLIFYPLTLLPKFLIFRVWDIALFGSFFFLALKMSQQLLPQVPLRLSISFLVLFCLNQLAGEVRYGQFNLLVYALVFFAFSSKRFFLLGLCCTVGTLLKPINFILFLWSLGVSGKQRWKVLASGFVTSVGCCLAFMMFFGTDELISSHITWRAFVEGPIASQWMPTLDGLSTWITQMGWLNPTETSRWVTLLALMITPIITWGLKDHITSFAFMGVLLAVLNPIPFKHNYVVLIGFYALVLQTLLSTKDQGPKALLFLGLVCSYISFQVYSPTTFTWPIWNWIKPNTYGFYSTLVLVFALFLSRRNRQLVGSV